MANYYAQAILAANSGVARDAQINTFAIGGISTITQTIANSWEFAIRTFYNSCNSADALRSRSQSGHILKIYNVVATRPNYPIYEFAWTLAAAPGSIQLPQEVALAVSYRNNSAATVPRGRRRGRIYVSGWGSAQNVAGRPALGVVELLADAYTAYCTSINTNGAGLRAGVWSRSGNTVYPVQEVYADNEWDTMRSRGGRSTQRFTRPIAP